MSNKIVAVKVIDGGQTLLDWYAIKIDEKESFTSLFEKIVSASEDGTPGSRFKRPILLKENTYSKAIVVSSTDNIEVSWGLFVKETLECFNASKISFELKSKQEQLPVKNAFTELFAAQKKTSENLKYPATFGENVDAVKRGDWRLKNDFIALMQEKGMGFTTGEDSVGKGILNTVTDCLFYLLPNLSKLSDRYITLPELFSRFYDCQTFEQSYNDPSKYKHKLKPLERDTLASHVQSLFRILTYPCMDTKRMTPLKGAVLSLANNLSKYCDYMSSQQQRVLDIHNMPHPARSPNDGIHTRLKQIPGCPRPKVTIDKYKVLEQCLSEKEDFEPLSLSDFCPIDRQKRYHYVQNLQLGIDVTFYHYSSGGPSEDLYFVWKSPKSLDLQRSNKIIHEIEKKIPVYHSRAMRKEFRERFSLVAKLAPSVIDEMYRYLTDDKSTPSSKVSKGVRQRLISMIDSQNPDIVFDMRALHEKSQTQFDAFFTEIDKFLQEYELKAVDDRRHGLVSHMAVAMSVRDLHNQITARLPQDTPAPSVDYLRLQFMPKNESLNTAVRYTGRFPLKFKIQSRQFNMYHIDAHYASALQRYLKSFAIKYRDNCALLSVDDKNHIPVGEPGVPIATVFRGKRSLAHTDVRNLAADHDTAAKLKLTPSVSLLVDIPESIDGEFYTGQVSVSLKDTIFQASTPLRHIAEISSFMKQTVKADKPIRLIYSDGGPDHRITYPSVKLALVGMFVQDDLDVLLAMRTAPYQSYKNWVERIMSILNLALQTIAIERSEMTPEHEKTLKTLGTMNSIRQKCENSLELKEALQSSIQPVLEQLNALFSRLQLKETPFLIGSPATAAHIDQIWDCVQTIDVTVEKTDTQSKQLKSKTELQKFLSHCTISRKYFFLIRKCGVPDCNICRPPRLQKEVFETLCTFPDPVPREDDPNRYKNFDDVYGTETTERHCPSMSQMLAGVNTEGSVVKMSGETVRDYIECIDCGKPRCIYSEKKLSTENKEDLVILKEEVIYTCGSSVVPVDHPLAGVVMVQPNVTCLAPIATHYYSTRAGFKHVCFSCGSKDIADISVQLKAAYQTVHPVCHECRERSVKERTRGEKKIGSEHKTCFKSYD